MEGAHLPRARIQLLVPLDYRVSRSGFWDVLTAVSFLVCPLRVFLCEIINTAF